MSFGTTNLTETKNCFSSGKSYFFCDDKIFPFTQFSGARLQGTAKIFCNIPIVQISRLPRLPSNIVRFWMQVHRKLLSKIDRFRTMIVYFFYIISSRFTSEAVDDGKSFIPFFPPTYPTDMMDCLESRV